MSETNIPTVVVRLSTQAFIILCRMFDGFYDDLKQQNEVDMVTESIAQSLLGGITYLQNQTTKPKEISIEFSYAETFMLYKLINEVLTHLPETEDQQRMRGWLEECKSAFDLNVNH